MLLRLCVSTAITQLGHMLPQGVLLIACRESSFAAVVYNHYATERSMLSCSGHTQGIARPQAGPITNAWCRVMLTQLRLGHTRGGPQTDSRAQRQRRKRSNVCNMSDCHDASWPLASAITCNAAWFKFATTQTSSTYFRTAAPPRHIAHCL